MIKKKLYYQLATSVAFLVIAVLIGCSERNWARGVAYVFLAVFPIIPAQCGYVFKLLPRTKRSVFVLSPRVKWRQCLLTETLGMLVMAAWLALILFPPFGDNVVDFCATIPFFTPIVLLYLYANFIPEYSLKRDLWRGIFIIITVAAVITEFFLFLPGDQTPDVDKLYVLGLTFCGAQLAVWLVSLFFGYKYHVKALEYQE